MRVLHIVMAMLHPSYTILAVALVFVTYAHWHIHMAIAPEYPTDVYTHMHEALNRFQE
jgi:hypothetical protein